MTQYLTLKFPFLHTHTNTYPSKIFTKPNTLVIYNILIFPFLSYPILSNPTLPYSTLSYAILAYCQVQLKSSGCKLLNWFHILLVDIAP